MAVIGVMGLIGSGKSAFAEYVSNRYGYYSITYGDVLRELAEKEGIEPTRENLQEMRRKTIKEFGKQHIGNLIVERIKDRENAVVDGIRLAADVKALMDNIDDLILVLIESDESARFRRLKKRSRKTDSQTIEGFKLQEKSEEELFEFEKIFPMADRTIKNNGTLEEFYSKIDRFISEFSLH